ncbi:MAG: hypothetical protein A3B38_00640 [Candidatus Levybacteria bacterium RIFCSPLOWO2_01_FULL_36_13]|nr:MAG: hypothetical protein A2684_01880 [Candidatus Levybacteria bacterium RIFCSPHIGHO2_01_FULL_36_15b]OGH35395.1 MAG: hypothetical protein A3B38_00640 [Candidatus Levybacteria bacterium RIFCSPLOWO2_01_FULL_36_13]
MKRIVTHTSPDMDAITSVWFIKRYLSGWEDAEVRFVPAGQRIGNLSDQKAVELKDPIEIISGHEVIHVDTGMGPLDHHQIKDTNTCAASLTFDYVKKHLLQKNLDIDPVKLQALERISDFVVEVDHFKEAFRKDALENYNNFSITEILDGLKFQHPNDDKYYVDFICICLDAILHDIENRIWAETEIKEIGIDFETKWGKGLGIETINDSVVKLAQLMGYIIVVRKDPRKGYVRIKARPNSNGEKGIDLTLVSEKLKKMDPAATWFLHVSGKMLLNGTPKNPKMKPSKLSLQEIIGVLKEI